MHKLLRLAVAASVVAASVTAASIGVAWSVSPPSTAATATPRSPIHRVIWVGLGPSKGCGVNSCGGGNAATPFTMPGQGKYAAAITVSFQYRTAGTATFGTGLQLGGHSRITPSNRPLAPSTVPSSTTLVYRSVLVGGRNYALSPTVSASQVKTARYSIGLRAVLIDINAYPVAPGTSLTAPAHDPVQHTVTRFSR